MVLQIEVTEKQQAHMGNTFKNDPPYGLPSIFPFFDFTLLWAFFFFSHKHLTLGVPLIITKGLNSILEPTDSCECQTMAISTRPIRGMNHSVIPT